MRVSRLSAALAAGASVLALGTVAVPASAAPGSVEPQVVKDSDMKATTITEGGASVLSTTRTIAHWHGATTDPSNGVTYGYNMVGANPNTCSGAACDATVKVDITPLIVHIDGRTFDGTDVVGPTLASPQFATNDYGSTPAATNASFKRGGGGALSQLDAGNQLQLQDATMRTQFDKVGSSPYHLRLSPTVGAPVVIDVPNNQGTLLQSGRGAVFASVNVGWWSSKINQLTTKADPTHLPLYLSNDIFLYSGGDPTNCCIIGYHGTRAVGYGGGSANSGGNAVVQTFAWASYVSPGVYARPDGGTYWALQDIHAISHEIAEWADDPFVNNTVEPWLTPTAPQYGCTGVLETGDPVVAIGFAMGSNAYDQGPNPNGTQSADGYYHPEDEALLPWFMRLPSDATGSEANQTSTGGRYTLMGDLNPFPGFRAPATGC